ncbi:hypothetical protein JNB11_02625 [Kocuria palustris]|nr:hypothetical protein [Kocuria palustris]
MAKRLIRDRGRTEKRRRTRDNDDLKQEPINEPVEDAPEPIVEAPSEDEDEGDMAYQALVTILKLEHKEPKPKSTKKQAKGEEEDDDDEDDEENAEEESDEELAGENLAENDDDDNEEEEDEEEIGGIDDEEDAQDPFESHFNASSEEFVAKAAEDVKNKWRLAKKTKVKNYTILENLPPLEKPLPIVPNPEKFLKQRVKLAVDYLMENDPLVEPMLNYQDINYAYKSHTNLKYRRLYATHCVNHVYKTRDRILKNTERLHANEDLEVRDQGFTRPKVLIVLPTRNAAYETIEQLIKFLGVDQVENHKRFLTQFHSTEKVPETKPNDFKDAFKGNLNDFFCIGLKFTRKAVKLYSAFYSADIIVASAIGLARILENPDKTKRQYDFLSSIEVLVIDRANHIEMQNWDNVQTILKYINKIPKEFHNADFSRIRMWSINDQAALFRQTLVFSEFTTPAINNVITTKLKNLAGKIRFKPVITEANCIMNSVALRIHQKFTRFPLPSPQEDPDARFKHFTNAVLPNIFKTSSYEDGILIFIPLYFDYLRVKKHMKDNTRILFVALDEYLDQLSQDRARYQFNLGKAKVMLYTERFHHFHRFEILGVKLVFLYGLPLNPLFYNELLRCMGKMVFKERAEAELCILRAMYSKWDTPALERIVGSERAAVMINGNELYEFK